MSATAALSSAMAGPSASLGRIEPSAVRQAQQQVGQSGRSEVDSAGNAGRGAQPKSNVPFRPDLEPFPGNDFLGGPSWLRNFGFILLMLALISAGVVGLRRIVSRFRRRTEADALPLLLFQFRKHDLPIAGNFPIQSNLATSPLLSPPVQSNRSVQPELVNVPRPAEDTLQLLPGRLEIASGNDRMKEIRFVKVPGPAVMTFGRYAGATHTHVQVESPTVSRLHASMRFAAGRWHIKNLSATNPVVVDGQQLPANGDEQVLNDGDQVEMGEVIFRFRSR